MFHGCFHSTFLTPRHYIQAMPHGWGGARPGSGPPSHDFGTLVQCMCAACKGKDVSRQTKWRHKKNPRWIQQPNAEALGNERLQAIPEEAPLNADIEAPIFPIEPDISEDSNMAGTGDNNADEVGSVHMDRPEPTPGCHDWVRHILISLLVPPYKLAPKKYLKGCKVLRLPLFRVLVYVYTLVLKTLLNLKGAY